MSVKTISSTEAQKHFGDLLMQVNREPITIKKHDKAVAVLLSIYEFQSIQQAKTEENKPSRLSSFIGAGQDSGRFASVEAVDSFISSNREEWQI